MKEKLMESLNHILNHSKKENHMQSGAVFNEKLCAYLKFLALRGTMASFFSYHVIQSNSPIVEQKRHLRTRLTETSSDPSNTTLLSRSYHLTPRCIFYLFYLPNLSVPSVMSTGRFCLNSSKALIF